ncbi:unnamed protein product, partial [Prorocentrum cordatum]
MSGDDPITREHALLCRILGFAACYDQVSVCELAHLETTAQRLQLLEEQAVETAFKPKGSDKNDKHKSHVLDDRAENILFLGAQESRGIARACPLLSTWIAHELKTGAAVAKDCRKVRLGPELHSFATSAAP